MQVINEFKYLVTQNDSQRFKGKTRYVNIDSEMYNRFDNRNYGFTFSYGFGKGQNAQRKRDGQQDEENRVSVSQ